MLHFNFVCFCFLVRSINFSLINKPFPGVWSAVGVRRSPVFLEKSASSALLWDQPQKPDSKSQEMTSWLSTTNDKKLSLWEMEMIEVTLAKKIAFFYNKHIFSLSLLQVTKCVYFCMIFWNININLLAKSFNFFLQEKAMYYYKNVCIFSIQNNIAKLLESKLKI